MAAFDRIDASIQGMRDMKSALSGWTRRQRKPRRHQRQRRATIRAGSRGAPFRKLKWNGRAVRRFFPSFFYFLFFSFVSSVFFILLLSLRRIFFFRRRLTVIRSAFIRVYRGPRQKEELARTNGKEILLGVGARKFIAAPAVESRRARESRRTAS